MELNFWRPPTNNDEGAGLQRVLRAWHHAGPRAKAASVEVIEGDETGVLVALQVPVEQTRAQLEYRMDAQGRLHVAAEIAPHGESLPIIPRIGMQLPLSADHETMEWFGKGPHETYIDRQAGAWIGKFSGTIEELFYRYTDPQESGNRTGVRWASIARPDGNGVRISAPRGSWLQVSVYPYEPALIELARHPIDLRRSDLIWLNIDHQQMGLGGTTSWGAMPLSQYQLPADRVYRYAFTLEPLRATAD